MTLGVILLTTSYVLLGLLLLSLNLQSAWSWQVKAMAIGTALPLFVATFIAIEAMLGWPSADDLPETFQLHAALVEEPSAQDGSSGAIYLWVTGISSASEDAIPDDEIMTSAFQRADPRAFALPYSRDLHNRVEDMQNALQQGRGVEGRHRRGSSMERRFAQPQGGIELYTPPSPPLPSKDG